MGEGTSLSRAGLLQNELRYKIQRARGPFFCLSGLLCSLQADLCQAQQCLPGTRGRPPGPSACHVEEGLPCSGLLGKVPVATSGLDWWERLFGTVGEAWAAL